MPSSSTTKQDNDNPRIIVIGAGISGLACARELQHRNYNVLVVEARSRCGGRLKGESISPSSIPIDVGGALIHGIVNNPVYGVCDQLGVNVCPVEDTVLLEEQGTPVDEAVDQEVSSTFNQCLEDTFSKIQALHEQTNTTTTTTNHQQQQQQQQESFGTLFDTTVPASLQNDLLFRWHQANLELSCGASFSQLGYDWNDDEPYEYTGQHVALPQSWNAVTSSLAEGLDILYDSPISGIRVVTPDMQKRQERQEKRKATTTTSTTQASPSPSRRSRRLQGHDATVRRSSRSNLGIASHKLSISDATSLSYDDASVRYPTRSNKKNTKKVQVTLQSGKVLEADAVVCTLPLGILKQSPQESGHVTFDPPLSETKVRAIQQLGCGLLNKCVLSFPHVFWESELEFLGIVGETPFLIFNAYVVTGQPILVFMFGGAQAFEVEGMTDAEIVSMCMDVLKNACSKKCADPSIPEPCDHVVTRWGHDVYARGAFVYIPPGVQGTKQLQAMSEPIVDTENQNRPLVLFAGEHTTPFHPSTIHGAFHSGIREAYRLDLNFYPDWNNNMEFEEDFLYKKTFSIKRKFNDTTASENAATTTASSPVPRKRRRRHGVMTLRKRPATNYANGSSKPSKLPAKSPVGLKRKGPAPSRRSSRIAGDPPVGIGGREKQEDRTLIRSYESYHDWNVIEEKVFPSGGGDDDKNNNKSIAQLRARYQQIKPKKPARLHPNILSQWIAPKEDDEAGSEK